MYCCMCSANVWIGRFCVHSWIKHIPLTHWQMYEHNSNPQKKHIHRAHPRRKKKMMKKKKNENQVNGLTVHMWFHIRKPKRFALLCFMIFFPFAKGDRTYESKLCYFVFFFPVPNVFSFMFFWNLWFNSHSPNIFHQNI